MLSICTLSLDMATHPISYEEPKIALFLTESPTSSFMEQLCGAWAQFSRTEQGVALQGKYADGEVPWAEVVDLIPESLLADFGLTRVQPVEQIFYNGYDTISLED